MKQPAWYAVLAAAALFLASGAASAQPALARVKTSGQLRIGTDATYPPFASSQGGEFTGLVWRGVDHGGRFVRDGDRDQTVRSRSGVADPGLPRARRRALAMVALLYLLLTFPLTRVAQQLERRWQPAARG